MKNWYFIRLYKANKYIFLVVLLFCFGQAFFSQKRIINFPWYTYDMYSRPYNLDSAKDVVFLYINDTLYNHENLAIWKESVLFNTAKMYNNLSKNQFIDPAIPTTNQVFRSMPECFKHYAVKHINNQVSNPEEYKNWLVQYIKDNTHTIPKKIDFRRVHLRLEGHQYVYQYNDPFLIIQ
ncbi:MAG TPA: hypothetical protein PLC61_06020 [Chitinophagales bacterium]|nr:hypothetical protein [Chitinophagales bacterium]HMU98930.1 hypothetical protein [Chitinophagales bacterium]HMV03367.1 hypothetical protein [Chitinophagales bacterium]HMW95057.1 hypothetical protein [Chitinophagales bacterium]HMY43416.1 hypothetical protein [Chitinophagales bacterium]